MSEQELLQSMRCMLKEELGSIHLRLDTIDQRLDRLEEDQGLICVCVNTLLKWSDKISEAYRFPPSQL